MLNLLLPGSGALSLRLIPRCNELINGASNAKDAFSKCFITVTSDLRIVISATARDLSVKGIKAFCETINACEPDLRKNISSFYGIMRIFRGTAPTNHIAKCYIRMDDGGIVRSDRAKRRNVDFSFNVDGVLKLMNAFLGDVRCVVKGEGRSLDVCCVLFGGESGERSGGTGYRRDINVCGDVSL